MSIKAGCPAVYGQISWELLVILVWFQLQALFLPLELNTSFIKKCSVACWTVSLLLTVFRLGLLACNHVNSIPQSTRAYFLFRNSTDDMSAHSPGCSSVRWSGELRCRLLIHVNIMEFPLELASWLDAIKIKSTNAAHTSAGSHLLYCRKQDNPFVWWKSFTTFPQFLLCSTEANKFSCNLLEKKKKKRENLIYRGKKAAIYPTKAIVPHQTCSESQWKRGHAHSFMLHGWTCCPICRTNHQS